MDIKTRIERVDFYVRNVHTRMPFRYGVATLTAVPILHVVMQAKLDGQSVTGLAGDILPPKWFDKDPNKTYQDNITDLIRAAQIAAKAFKDASSLDDASPFSVWRYGYHTTLDVGRVNDLNNLTSSHGSSLMERALIDAIGQYSGMSYSELLNDNVLSIDLSALHPELEGYTPDVILPNKPLEEVKIRHTVGLADPLSDNDLMDNDILDDGLPQTLEQYLHEQKLTYFKVKVSGDLENDLKRIESISDILNESDYAISLDGNEQYNSVPSFVKLLDRIESDFPLFWGRVMYIEQPLERDFTLDQLSSFGIQEISERKPLLIDESDTGINSFLEAINLGYTGVSSKACKGLIKAIANAALAYNRGSNEHFLSGEDLMNLPIVPLHQDLVHVAVLGIRHVERNGHHYVCGLNHLSDSERQRCLTEHSDLYHEENGLASLRISSGSISVKSLHIPGLGVGNNIDVDSMIPLENWNYGTLLNGFS